jgi:hypothetical protein
MKATRQAHVGVHDASGIPAINCQIMWFTAMHLNEEKIMASLTSQLPNVKF